MQIPAAMAADEVDDLRRVRSFCRFCAGRARSDRVDAFAEAPAAHVELAVARGSVSLPHGFAEPAVGAVTTGHIDTDPLTGTVQQSGLRVRVALASP